ncbi:hypothetical protein Noda2021_06880 [Candidatus Dependentiae bacterium Noda2021]|nr:hypothetical protein Noda2021_06880 [Candidatus Dependentiae bacterium Noda2021]
MKKVLILCFNIVMVNSMDTLHLKPLRGVVNGQSPEAIAYHIQEFIVKPKSDLLDKDMVAQAIKCAPEILNLFATRIIQKDISCESMPQGLLISGVSGTGKTTLAHSIMTLMANNGWIHRYVECGLDKSNDISTHTYLKRLIDPLLRSKQKSVVFLNDIELFFSKSYCLEKNLKAAQTFSKLMKKNMKAKNIFFICTTSDTKDIFNMTKEPFDQFSFKLTLPNSIQSRKAVCFYLGKKINGFSKEDVSMLGDILQDKTYFEIEYTVHNALWDACSAGIEVSYDSLLKSFYSDQKLMVKDAPPFKVPKIFKKISYIITMLSLFYFQYCNVRLMHLNKLFIDLLNQKNVLIINYEKQVSQLLNMLRHYQK